MPGTRKRANSDSTIIETTSDDGKGEEGLVPSRWFRTGTVTLTTVDSVEQAVEWFNTLSPKAGGEPHRRRPYVSAALLRDG